MANQTTTQTTQQKLTELIGKREASARIAVRMLSNRIKEETYAGRKQVKNANVHAHIFDPVYRKIADELHYTLLSNLFKMEYCMQSRNIDRELMRQIETRTMDEKTYTFLLESSPETIAQHLCYNNWEI